MNTKTFLEKIFKNKKINFRALKEGQKPLNLNGYYNQYIEDKLKQLNEQGYNIYFTVNSGGTKKEQINKINAFFIDCDCGRDDKGNYFDLDIVNQYKKRVLQRVQDFGLVPSLVIDSRNGYHVYWLVNNANVEEFQEVQNKLIHFFNSDERVNTPERIMRLPNFYWTKDIDNQYLCTIYQYNDIRYNADEFITHLNSKVPDFIPETKNILVKTKVSKQFSIDKTNEHINAIRNLDVNRMKELLVNIDISNVKHIREKKWTDISIYNYIDILVHQKPPITFKTDEEFYKFIDTIDLYNFLGVENKTFNCILPFHDDKRPSAGIIINEKGHFVYNCFGCGFKGGIIKLIEAISGCTRYHAINFIKQVYNIDLKTEWQKEQQAILEENIKYLTSGKMEEDYPTLWTYIKPRLDKLILLNVYAKNNIMSEDYSINDYPIFFGSLNYFMKLFATNSKKTTNNTIQLFALLDLIDKVPLEDIPDKILSKAKQQKKKGYNKIVSYYQIKSYCYNQLHNAEDKAKLLKNNNFTMCGISREWVLRTFGKDIANKIYPQYKEENEKGTSKASDERTNQIINVIMNKININGYVTEQEVIEELKNKYGKVLTQIQLKRSLQEILNNYNLKRIRANKKLKEQYGVTTKGYPFLIIKNN